MRASLVSMVRRLASVGCAVKTGWISSRSSSACSSSLPTPDCFSSRTAASIVSVTGPPEPVASRSRRRSTRTRSRSSARLTSLKYDENAFSTPRDSPSGRPSIRRSSRSPAASSPARCAFASARTSSTSS